MLRIVLLAALVLALPAGGRSATAPPAELFVFAYDTTPGAVAETDVDLSLNATAGSVSEYIPAGYGLDLDAAPGAVVGSATVHGPEPFSDSLLAADPAAFTEESCAEGIHAAVWTAGPLTVFVDPADDGYQLTFCPLDEAADVDLDLRGVLTNPAVPGLAVWRAVVAAGDSSIEARSVVAFPQTLGFRASVAARPSRIALRGRLLSAGKARAGINVRFAIATRADLSDARDLGAARTRADGSYTLTRPLPHTRVKRRLTLIAYVNFYVQPCADCAGQTIAPPPAELVSVTVPRAG
jgi:hypothetical protein